VEYEEAWVGVFSDEGGSSNNGADVSHKLKEVFLGSFSNNKGFGTDFADRSLLNINSVFSIEGRVDTSLETASDLEFSLGLLL